MEAKERMADARGKKAFSEETESFGIMTNLKADVNAYDTTRSFLGTMARGIRYERPEVGRELQTAGTVAEMFEPKGQIASRMGSAEVPHRVSKRDSRGGAAVSQSVLRVT